VEVSSYTYVSSHCTYVIGTVAIIPFISFDTRLKIRCAMFSVIKVYPKILE
jgi:hypothetical protein